MEIDDDDAYDYSKLKTKGKSKILPKLLFVELKLRRHRQGKCVGAALKYYDFIENKPQLETSSNQQTQAFISIDFWIQIANYIKPEDVQRFSLICGKSANSLNSRTFWLQLYYRYCQQTFCNNKKLNLQLPEDLQIEHLKNCDKKVLRQRVIQALFYCYPPFKTRLETPYTLETLIGRTYVSSWHKLTQCVWIMCFTFRLSFPLNNATTSKEIYQTELENTDIFNNIDNVVDDWECLADEEHSKLINIKKSTELMANDLNGISLLVLFCNRFIPFPSDIIYNHNTSPFRLAAARELLSTDMRSINLELDFISNTKDQIITVKYTKLQKFKVLPWWHPDFRVINNCL